MRYISKLIISVAVCEIVGVLGEVLGSGALATWYGALQQPSYAAPGWLFSPVWFVLFFLTGIAVSFLWQKGLHIRPIKRSLLIFLIMLVVNAGWFVLFYEFHFVLYGAIAAVVLCVLAVISTFRFYAFSAAGGSLMVPFTLWTVYIALLNVSLYLLAT